MGKREPTRRCRVALQRASGLCGLSMAGQDCGLSGDSRGGKDAPRTFGRRVGTSQGSQTGVSSPLQPPSNAPVRSWSRGCATVPDTSTTKPCRRGIHGPRPRRRSASFGLVVLDGIGIFCSLAIPPLEQPTAAARDGCWSCPTRRFGPRKRAHRLVSDFSRSRSLDEWAAAVRLASVARQGALTRPCMVLLAWPPLAQVSSAPLRHNEPQLAESASFQPSPAPQGHACLIGQGLIWRGLDSRSSLSVSNRSTDKPPSKTGLSHPRTRLLLLGVSPSRRRAPDETQNRLAFRLCRAWAVPGFAPPRILSTLGPRSP